MKPRALFALMIVSALLTVLLCACGPSLPKVTVISKQSVNSPTQTTTTTTTTTTTSLTTTTTVMGKPTGPDTEIVPGVSTDTGNSVTGDAIAALAISLVGAPYEVGKSGPNSFDNPGFVVYCYRQNGFTVPRYAKNMTGYGKEVYPDEIQPGDILLFCNEIGEEVGFAGIYIGNNRFISCNNPESPTKEQRLDASYWAQRFVMARRFVQD